MAECDFFPIKSPPSIQDYLPSVGSAAKEKEICLSQTARPSKSDSTLVSVVTIVRNGAQTIARAIESVISQDYGNLEYIVIDGQSTDGTLDVLRAYGNRISFWLSQRDEGVSDAFNKGIALAEGEVIGILNSDDWYEPGAIRLAMDALMRSAADIVVGRMQYWENNSRTFLVSSNPSQLTKGMSVSHPTVFARRSCYEQLGLYRLDFRYAMNYEWLLRAKQSGKRFLAVSACIANMQLGGISDKGWIDGQREVARARALNIPGKSTRFAYHSYVWAHVIKGAVRRSLDRMGLKFVRRIYRHLYSPQTVRTSRERGGQQ